MDPTPLALVAVCAALVAACGGRSEPVSLRFEPRIDGRSVACGDGGHRAGRSDTPVVLRRLAFFVNDLQLRGPDGEWEPVTFEPGPSASETLALVDLSEGSAPCAQVAPSTLDGEVRAGSYDAVRFTVGVPDDLNHLDLGELDPPLTSSSLMWWGWRVGFQFVHLTLEPEPEGTWDAHLGAVDCDGDEVGGYRCTAENPMRVELEGLALAADPAVVVDLGAWLADVDFGQERTAEDPVAGCHSTVDDPECEPLYHKLGVPFLDDEPVGPQVVFRLP